MTHVATFGTRDVSNGWVWRDRDGGLWKPSKMETRHLFHTLRMIWNNFMPERMRVGVIRLYAFPDFYTDAYFRDAVRAIGRELNTRQDLTPAWRAQLAEMASWFTEWEEVNEPAISPPTLMLSKA